MAQFDFSTTGAEVVEKFKDRVQGKTILITGPSEGGIGAETAVTLAAASPSFILLAGRTWAKVQPVIDRITFVNPNVQIAFIPLDLASQASVREAAAKINSSVQKIDILINNAAIMASPWAKTVDGIESQFGTNHIGHFLLTNLIMEKVIAAGPDSRIINLSSGGHRIADVRLDDHNFQDGTVYNAAAAYGQAKTANMLFSVALASRLKSKQIQVFSPHPGSVRTNLQVYMTPELREQSLKMVIENTGSAYRSSDAKTLQQGCSTTLVAALDPQLSEHSGAYLEDGNIFQAESYASDPERAEMLWALSEQLVGQKFTFA